MSVKPQHDDHTVRAPHADAVVRVVLVDDHAVVREGYRRLLESESEPALRVVAEHASADEANAWLLREAEAVDVLVLDLSMPGRDGLDFARRCAARWPALRLLVFTMHDHPAMVAQALAAGVAGYVTKTSAPEMLVACLKRVARGETGVLSPDVMPQHTAADEARPPHMSLSPREFDVLRLLIAGQAVEDIAQRLHLSPKTVSNLQAVVRSKLGVRSAVELLRYGQRYGID